MPPFYARPPKELSPGDIFPEIPFSVQLSPIRVARNSGINPKPGDPPVNLKRIYTFGEGERPANLRLGHEQGEETLASTRMCRAMFLTWGSEVESVERRVAENGRVGKRSWLAAPIYRLDAVPEGNQEEDPETRERVSMRQLIRQGKARDNFYLPPLPGEASTEEHYVELRKITPVGIQFFMDAKSARLASLMPEALNELYSNLLWSLTRYELFFHPIKCECGKEVPLDVRFHGQNTDPEPWE
jgi:hypothetical protein